MYTVLIKKQTFGASFIKLREMREKKDFLFSFLKIFQPSTLLYGTHFLFTIFYEHLKLVSNNLSTVLYLSNVYKCGPMTFWTLRRVILNQGCVYPQWFLMELQGVLGIGFSHLFFIQPCFGLIFYRLQLHSNFISQTKSSCNANQ